jgi:phosphoribosylanthranilate isomerase
MWVKICGNTNLGDALAAAEAGADAVGFVFAESPRRVTVEQVKTITPHLPGTLEKFGVFVDWDFEQIARVIEKSGLTGAQLHSTPDAFMAAKLREHFGDGLKILRVIHYGGDLGLQLKAAQDDSNVDAVLVDSRTAMVIGGTGIQFNWQIAQRSFRESPLRLVVAGGLNPENVAIAIHTLCPWGVDVSSGVESAPGKKDVARVKAFVQAAKAATRETTAAL